MKYTNKKILLSSIVCFVMLFTSIFSPVPLLAQSFRISEVTDRKAVSSVIDDPESDGEKKENIAASENKDSTAIKEKKLSDRKGDERTEENPSDEKDTEQADIPDSDTENTEKAADTDSDSAVTDTADKSADTGTVPAGTDILADIDPSPDSIGTSADTGSIPESTGSSEDTGSVPESTEDKTKGISLPVILTAEGKDYTVTITDSDGKALPEDAVLKVEEIQDKNYRSCIEEANEEFRLSKKVIRDARFFDITILSDGKEIQPSDTLNVSICFRGEDKTFPPDDDTAIVHFEEDHGRMSLVRIDSVNIRDDRTVNFEAESFSVYGICYTADLSYDENSSCLAFRSPASFSILSSYGKGWDGQIEYSTDASVWTDWTGSSLTAAARDGQYYLYFRGSGNSVIIGQDMYYRWTLTANESVSCEGNIMSLIDYKNPPLKIPASYCFANMFRDWTRLISAPELPATTLTSHCYYSMFAGCTGLTSVPELPATTLGAACYNSMFWGCTNLRLPPELPANILKGSCYANMFNGCSNMLLSAKEESVNGISYNIPYRVPSSGTGTVGSKSLYNMFYNTGGPFSGTPEINTSYYLPGSVYAEFDSESGQLKIFRGVKGLYSDRQIIGTKTYFTDIEKTTGLNGPEWKDKNPDIKKVVIQDPFKPKTAYQMFNGCCNLEIITDLKNMDTSEVVNMQSMFNGCSKLTELDLSGLDTSSVTDMQTMFNGCTKLKSVTIGSAFSFSGKHISTENKQAILPSPPSAAPYTGKWIKSNDSAPAGAKTSVELRDGYDSNISSWAGTWVWEKAQKKALRISSSVSGDFADASKEFTYTLISIGNDSPGAGICDYTLTRGNKVKTGTIATGESFTMDSEDDTMDIQIFSSSKVLIKVQDNTNNYAISWKGTPTGSGQPLASGDTATAAITVSDDLTLTYLFHMPTLVPTGVNTRDNIFILLWIFGGILFLLTILNRFHTDSPCL